MKVIKKGNLKKLQQEKKPWIGKVVSCRWCDGCFKLEAKDKVRFDKDQDLNVFECPTKRCNGAMYWPD